MRKSNLENNFLIICYLLGGFYILYNEGPIIFRLKDNVHSLNYPV